MLVIMGFERRAGGSKAKWREERTERIFARCGMHVRMSNPSGVVKA